MTKRERLLAIYYGKAPDRPAVRLWGLKPGQELLHPAYQVVRDAGAEKTDLVYGAGSPFNLCWGAKGPPVRNEDRPTGTPEWVDKVAYVDTPAGTLRGVYRASTCKRPGYMVEHLIKEPADLKKLLSVPYEPHPFDATDYFRAEQEVGDRGITVFGLPHAMYGLQHNVGSENFALWSIECREAMVEVMSEYARRILEHVKAALAAGIRGIFGWVGPELCIPPLMSVRDFDEFVAGFDKPIIDEVHNGGGRVWVHCHGKMGPVLERFMDMGVDVLNPLEPPPMGDVTVAEAFERVGDGMGIEGGIETHELMTLPPSRMKKRVAEVLEQGRGRRFILCPSSGYMEDPTPTDRYIENQLIFVNEGVRIADSMAAG
jgi:hypothetical protein